MQNSWNNAKTQVWVQKYLIWVFLGKNLKKLSWYSKSAPSNLSNCKILWKNKQKQKMAKFETRHAWFGYFGAEIWKLYCHIWNRHPRFCLITEFHEITKIPKFRTNNVLFGYFFLLKFQKKCLVWVFWRKRLFGVFLGCNLKIILSYLKSAPYNFSICKILRKMKKSELGTKNVFLGTFLDWNLK